MVPLQRKPVFYTQGFSSVRSWTFQSGWKIRLLSVSLVSSWRPLLHVGTVSGQDFESHFCLMPPTLQSRSEQEPGMNLRACRDVNNPSLSP